MAPDSFTCFEDTPFLHHIQHCYMIVDKAILHSLRNEFERALRIYFIFVRRRTIEFPQPSPQSYSSQIYMPYEAYLCSTHNGNLQKRFSAGFT